MPFELCTKPGKCRGMSYAVIYRNSTMSFNKVTMREFGMDAVPYFNLFFDRVAEKIGINPCEKVDVGAITANKTRVYSLRGLYKYFGIEHEKYVGRYIPQTSTTPAFLFEIDLKGKK